MSYQRTRTPRPGRKAEIVLRDGWMIDGSGDQEVPIPEVLILANAAGYRYLARVFQYMADRRAALRSDPDNDPDDHEHLFDYPGCCVDQTISDRIEFRMGTLSPANRRAVLDRYGITAGSAKRGSLVERYRSRLEAVERFFAECAARRQGEAQC